MKGQYKMNNERSVSDGKSFSNGQGGLAETMAYWYAGSTDDRILSHWWCM